MQSKTSFIAGLFVLALCGFTAGGLSLYERFDVWRNGQDAQMSLARPDQKLPDYDDGMGFRVLDVQYVSSAGTVVVPNKSVLVPVAERLVDGQSIPITYMTNNPSRIMYSNYEAPNPWGWLVAGFVSLGVAIYALRLRKRELGR